MNGELMVKDALLRWVLMNEAVYIFAILLSFIPVLLNHQHLFHVETFFDLETLVFLFLCYTL